MATRKSVSKPPTGVTRRSGVSRNMVRRSKKRRRTQVSSIELLVQQWLREAGIPFQTQYAIGRCHVDLFIEPELVIEVNGCFYHDCPKCKPGKAAHNKGAQAKDKKRYMYLLGAGYDLLLLWEHDLKPEFKEHVLSKIRSKLK